MVSVDAHEREIQQLNEVHQKDKMEAIGNLEIQWQERVSQERNMHKRVLEEKDLIVRDQRETMSAQKKERDELSEQLHQKSKSLRVLQSTLASKEQLLAQLTNDVQMLQATLDKDKRNFGAIIKETSQRIKESMNMKIVDLSDRLRESCSSLAEAKEKIEGHEKLLNLCRSALQRSINQETLAALGEAFPDCGSLQWLKECPDCADLRAALNEVRAEADGLQALVRTDQRSANSEMELVTLLHRLYWVFRRSESRGLQLIVQKSYLQNCALRQLENFPQGKRTLKTIAIVIMAVYR